MHILDAFMKLDSYYLQEGVFDSKPSTLTNWKTIGTSTTAQTQATQPKPLQPKPLPIVKKRQNIVTIVYDPKAHKLRARGDDGTHGIANVAFPNNLRNQEGQQYEVDELIWNGKNYRASGKIKTLNSTETDESINNESLNKSLAEEIYSPNYNDRNYRNTMTRNYRGQKFDIFYDDESYTATVKFDNKYDNAPYYWAKIIENKYQILQYDTVIASGEFSVLEDEVENAFLEIIQEAMDLLIRYNKNIKPRFITESLNETILKESDKALVHLSNYKLHFTNEGEYVKVNDNVSLYIKYMAVDLDTMRKELVRLYGDSFNDGIDTLVGDDGLLIIYDGKSSDIIEEIKKSFSAREIDSNELEIPFENCSAHIAKVNFDFISPKYKTKETIYDKIIRFTDKSDFNKKVLEVVNNNISLWTEKQVEKEFDGETRMEISVSSGIGADGFKIRINDIDSGKEVFKNSYSYGYSASYRKDWATSRKPFTTDIINELKKRFNVVYVDVIPGENVFAGRKVTDDVVADFKKSYLNEASYDNDINKKDDFEMNFTNIFEELNRLYEADETAEAEELVADSTIEEEAEETVDVTETEEAEPEADEPKKIALECSKCGAIVIKEETDLVIDEKTDLVNVDEACTFCGETAGFTIMGVITPYEVVEEVTEEVTEELKPTTTENKADVNNNSDETADDEPTDEVTESALCKKTRKPMEECLKLRAEKQNK